MTKKKKIVSLNKALKKIKPQLTRYIALVQNKISSSKTTLLNQKDKLQKPRMKKTWNNSVTSIKNFQSSASMLRLSMKEQTFFARRLAFLINANIPVLESLHIIREQTISKRYAKVLDNVIGDVSNGQSLSMSLGKFSHIFGDFSINIINVGETTGVLSENLEYLAEEMKKKSMLRKKVIGAFVYPVIVTLATLGITSFLIIYLFPKIMPVFASLHTELPWSTRTVIAISNFMRFHGIGFVLSILALVTVATLLIKKNNFVHFFFDRTLIRLPLIGEMIKNYNLANLSRTFGLLLKSGITLSESIPIVARTSTNVVYKKECDALLRLVSRGEKLSTHFRSHRDLFPDMVGQIVSVGERSGNLPNSFTYLSELYEAEVEDFTKNLSSLIEPVLMIFMGVLVGFIAISIITPIYSITQNLHA